jgi:hypothetical protein
MYCKISKQNLDFLNILLTYFFFFLMGGDQIMNKLTLDVLQSFQGIKFHIDSISYFTFGIFWQKLQWQQFCFGANIKNLSSNMQSAIPTKISNNLAFWMWHASSRNQINRYKAQNIPFWCILNTYFCFNIMSIWNEYALDLHVYWATGLTNIHKTTYFVFTQGILQCFPSSFQIVQHLQTWNIEEKFEISHIRTLLYPWKVYNLSN